MTELRGCVKVEVAVLGSPSLIVLMVSVDVKQHWTTHDRAQGLCESRGGCPGLPVLNGHYGLCGRKVTLNLNGVQSEPRGSVDRKVELGSHRVSWPVFCFRLFSGYCLCDFVPHSCWKWLVAKCISCFALASSTPPYCLP